MTNVVAISRSFQEADIIEPWVRHTLTHVDRIVVSDNDSYDDTKAILAALVAEGLPLEVRHEKTIGDYQAAVFTGMMREQAVDGGADWIVPLDTDEFIETAGDTREPDEGRSDRPAPRLADLLGASGMEAFCYRWQTFAWSSTDDQSDLNPVTRMRHRLTDETTYHKVVVPRALARDATMQMGNHIVPGHVARELAGVRLCHFPLRSVDQYRLKGVLSYLQSACKPGWKASGQNFQFGELPNALNIEEQALTTYSRRYASQMPAGWEPHTICRPLDYRGGPLRYTTNKERFLPVLLRHAEAMALRICDLETERRR